MKRGEFSENEQKLLKQVETEYLLFKYKTLSKNNKEIYKLYDKIRFYEYIYEYFMYAESLEKEHLLIYIKYDNIIAIMYELYVKYEYLRYDRWEDIEEILNVLVRK